ncbi:MAG: hypothetical protein R8K49_01795 [Mariprofundaceae bacterium]
MQREMNRLRRRKRSIHKIIGVVAICLLVSLVMVSIRSCSDQLDEVQNDSYHPMDTQRLQGNRP